MGLERAQENEDEDCQVSGLRERVANGPLPELEILREDGELRCV